MGLKPSGDLDLTSSLCVMKPHSSFLPSYLSSSITSSSLNLSSLLRCSPYRLCGISIYAFSRLKRMEKRKNITFFSSLHWLSYDSLEDYTFAVCACIQMAAVHHVEGLPMCVEKWQLQREWDGEWLGWLLSVARWGHGTLSRCGHAYSVLILTYSSIINRAWRKGWF